MNNQNQTTSNTGHLLDPQIYRTSENGEVSEIHISESSYFVKNKSRFISTLFRSRTASGVFTKVKNGYQLIDFQGNLIAAIDTSNTVRSAYRIKGRPFYMFGLDSLTANRLGIRVDGEPIPPPLS